MSRDLVLVTVSARVAPGVLTWTAWQALHAAATVVVPPELQVHRAALEAAGLHPVPELGSGDGDACVLVEDQSARGLADAYAGRGLSVRTLAGVAELPGSQLLGLVALMDRLRSPGGCPWDAEQTHASLTQYLIEETYEVLEAIELDDRTALVEELGDLLLQVVFHARIGQERGDEAFSVDDVAAGIVDKLVRRHPHVFAGRDLDAHTERGWDAIKKAEKGRSSAVEGVPMAQPALALAAKMIGRVERAGLSVSTTDEAEVSAEIAAGDALMEVVAELRRAGIDPEAALRAAVRRYAARVQAVENAAALHS